MPGSFYYTPVDPGYDRGIGAGIVAGINQGVQNVSAGLDRQRQQAREDAETKYRHGRDVVQDKRNADADKRQEQLFDLNIAENGGGRGQAPTIEQTTEVPIGADPLPQPSYGTVESRGAHGGMAGGVDRPQPQFGTSWMKANAPDVPSLGGPKSITTTEQVADPRYRQVGDFYIEDPTYKAEEASRRATASKIAIDDADNKSKSAARIAEQEEKESERRDAVGRISGALMAEHKGLSRERAEGQAMLMVDGKTQYDDIYPHYAPSAGDHSGTVNATSIFQAKTEAARDRGRALEQLATYARTYTMKPEERQAEEEQIEQRYQSVLASINAGTGAAPAAPSGAPTTTAAGPRAAQPQTTGRPSMFDTASIDDFLHAASTAPAPKEKKSAPAGKAEAPPAQKPKAEAPTDTLADSDIPRVKGVIERFRAKKMSDADIRKKLLDAGMTEHTINKAFGK